VRVYRNIFGINKQIILMSFVIAYEMYHILIVFYTQL